MRTGPPPIALQGMGPFRTWSWGPQGRSSSAAATVSGVLSSAAAAVTSAATTTQSTLSSALGHAEPGSGTPASPTASTGAATAGGEGGGSSGGGGGGWAAGAATAAAARLRAAAQGVRGRARNPSAMEAVGVAELNLRLGSAVGSGGWEEQKGGRWATHTHEGGGVGGRM
jgi:hypothetical protein